MRLNSGLVLIWVAAGEGAKACLVTLEVACYRAVSSIPSQQHLERHFSVAGDWLLPASRISLPHEGE